MKTVKIEVKEHKAYTHYPYIDGVAVPSMHGNCASCRFLGHEMSCTNDDVKSSCEALGSPVCGEWTPSKLSLRVIADATHNKQKMMKIGNGYFRARFYGGIKEGVVMLHDGDVYIPGSRAPLDPQLVKSIGERVIVSVGKFTELGE